MPTSPRTFPAHGQERYAGSMGFAYISRPRANGDRGRVHFPPTGDVDRRGSPPLDTTARRGLDRSTRTHVRRPRRAWSNVNTEQRPSPSTKSITTEEASPCASAPKRSHPRARSGPADKRGRGHFPPTGGRCPRGAGVTRTFPAHGRNVTADAYISRPRARPGPANQRGRGRFPPTGDVDRRGSPPPDTTARRGLDRSTRTHVRRPRRAWSNVNTEQRPSPSTKSITTEEASPCASAPKRSRPRARSGPADKRGRGHFPPTGETWPGQQARTRTLPAHGRKLAEGRAWRGAGAGRAGNGGYG